MPLLDTIQLIEMSDEEYFSDKWAGYISNSKLALINPDQDGSPQIYKEGLSKHPKYSDSLVFGSAVHELVLQPKEFAVVNNVDRPTAKMGAMADELYKTFLRFLCYFFWHILLILKFSLVHTSYESLIYLWLHNYEESTYILHQMTF